MLTQLLIAELWSIWRAATMHRYWLETPLLNTDQNFIEKKDHQRRSWIVTLYSEMNPSIKKIGYIGLTFTKIYFCR